jgi:hypothetical protein
MAMRWYGRPENDAHQLGLAPRLASWEKSGHRDQVRLREYLDDTKTLLAKSRVDGPWALRLDVGLPVDRNRRIASKQICRTLVRPCVCVERLV